MSIVINSNKGGANQNWDNVLSQGGKFLTDRNFDFNNKNLFFEHISFLNFKLRNDDSGEFRITFLNNNYFNFFSSTSFQQIFFYDANQDNDNLFSFYFDNGGAFIYKLGDYQAYWNNTYFLLDDENRTIELQAFDIIKLTYGQLIINSGTSGGVHTPSGEHLEVLVNGNIRYIQLLN